MPTISLKAEGRVRTACSLCQNFCGLIAHVKDGKVVKLEGDPANPRNHGHLCAKGLSGLVNAYSPRRVRQPLIRTNPEKGLGIDPQWREIPWEEAISLVAQKVRQVKEKAEREIGGKLSSRPSTNLVNVNPWSQRIMLATFDHWSLYSGVQMAWTQALDAYQGVFSADCYCGNAVHPPSYLNTSTFEVTVDPEYSKYVLLVASQAGSIIHYDTMNVARHIAERRPGDIKVVAVDPMAGFAASKAEEWIPIRPGTDTAFVLGLLNLLLNEYKIYDAEFLKTKTNAPYLVGPDGRYAKNRDTGKPQVWDPSENRAKDFDDPSIKDFALEGTHVVDDQPCTTAFEALKDHVKGYTPERVSEITTIPAATLRRIAQELGEAACIGQTITIDGKELPYRPVSVCWYRGLSAHRHAFSAGLAIILLPTILGAVQVPGGIHGHPPAPEYMTDEGLLSTNPWFGVPYPPRPVTKPRRVDAFELFPVAVYSTQFVPLVLSNPEAFGIDRRNFVWPEILFIWRDNVVKNAYSPEQVVDGLKKIPFIVSFNVDLDETALTLADIVFPDLHHLEKLGEGLYLRVNEPGYWYAAKPAMQPPFDPPWNSLVNNAQIFLEIADRAGFLREVYEVLNSVWKLKGTPYELDPTRKYPYEELVDRRLRTWLGPDKGLDWLLSDEGGLLVWGAKAEEKYKGAFRKARLHVYHEFMTKAKEDLDRVVNELGIRWDTSDYEPLPDWKPCPSYAKRSGEYDLFLINYKMPMMAHAVGRFNPVAMQLVQSRKHLEGVLIHPDTAARLGIRDGDEVTVETWKGRSQQGRAHLTERVHPEVVASPQHRLKRGVDFNYLAVLDEDTMDYVSGAVDACLLVKVRKAQ